MANRPGSADHAGVFPAALRDLLRHGLLPAGRPDAVLPPAWYRHLVESGLGDWAAAAAAAIVEPHRRAAIRSIIAVAFADSGQPREGAAIARSTVTDAEGVDDRWTRAYTQAAIAGSLAATHQHNEALHLAEGIGDAGARTLAWCEIAGAMQASAQSARAAEIAERAGAEADRVGFPGRRSEALTAAVSALAATGRWDHARHLAGGIDDPWCRAEALTAVALFGAEGGNTLTAALAAARQVSYPAWRAEAEASVAAVLARLGDAAGGQAIADGIDDPVWRAEALAAVAAAMTDDHRKASALVNRALVLGQRVGYPWWSSDGLAAALAGLLARSLDSLWLADLIVPPTARSRVLVAVAQALSLHYPSDAGAAVGAVVCAIAGAATSPPVSARSVTARPAADPLPPRLGTDLFATCVRTWPAHVADLHHLALRPDRPSHAPAS